MSHPAPFCLTAYEHETLSLARYPELRPCLDALERLQQQHQACWFTRLHSGLRLHQFVGVIQVPGLLLEILPKADDARRTSSPEAATQWREVLLQMLAYVYDLPLTVPEAAHLAHSPHAMLDLFVIALLEQADQLQHQGLVKHYRIVEANQTALKGRLLFQPHITHNLAHGERFFTRHQTYDQAHPLNCLLRMALQVAGRQVRSSALATRTRALLLHWPELPNVPVPTEFPLLNRKTERYRQAVELALLLLRGHSPTLRGGPTEAVALVFNMNTLFERYVARHLQRAAAKHRGQVRLQNKQTFWPGIRIRPDLIVTLTTGSKPEERQHTVVLDTKWKLPTRNKPSAADIQQVFAYCHLWQASHGILLYPQIEPSKEGNKQPYSPSAWAPEVAITGHVHYASVLQGGTLNSELGSQLFEYLRKCVTKVV